MPKKRFSVEQIISHLCEAEVFLAQGQTVGEICRHIGISEQSYYRWRREYGGLKVDQARRLMARHSNLYGSIKHRTLNNKHASRKVALRDGFGRIEADWLRLFERFTDRFMIGADITPGTFVEHGKKLRPQLKHMQAFLRELPPHLLGPIARDNAIRVFNLAAGGNSRKEKSK